MVPEETANRNVRNLFRFCGGAEHVVGVLVVYEQQVKNVKQTARAALLDLDVPDPRLRLQLEVTVIRHDERVARRDVGAVGHQRLQRQTTRRRLHPLVDARAREDYGLQLIGCLERCVDNVAQFDVVEIVVGLGGKHKPRLGLVHAEREERLAREAREVRDGTVDCVVGAPLHLRRGHVRREGLRGYLLERRLWVEDHRNVRVERVVQQCREGDHASGIQRQRVDDHAHAEARNVVRAVVARLEHEPVEVVVRCRWLGAARAVGLDVTHYKTCDMNNGVGEHRRGEQTGGCERAHSLLGAGHLVGLEEHVIGADELNRGVGCERELA
eukprot:PhM_4_TR5685/c0_g1_i1/m.73892